MPSLRTLLIAGAVFSAAAGAPAIAAAQDQQVIAYTSATLNLRDGPGTEFAVVTSMPAGAQVTVTYCSNTESWCFLTYGSYAGWASSRYLTTTAPQYAQAQPQYQQPQPQYQQPQQTYVPQYPETTYPQQPQVAVAQPYPPTYYPPQTYPPQPYPPQPYPPQAVYPAQQQVIIVQPGPRVYPGGNYWVGPYGWWWTWFR